MSFSMRGMSMGDALAQNWTTSLFAVPTQSFTLAAPVAPTVIPPTPIYKKPMFWLVVAGLAVGGYMFLGRKGKASPLVSAG